MARAKITAYVTPTLADMLQRVAAIEDRSVSDIVEDAIAKRFAQAGRESEHAATMARLEQVMRRLGVIEKAQETHFELTAHAARFMLSLAPEIPEPDRAALSARGAERFGAIMDSIVSRLSRGRSTWRDTQASLQPPAPAAAPAQGTAAQ
jgi:hypothetical protein